MNSVFHSLICFIFPIYAMSNTAMGYDPGLLSLGTTIYTCVILVVSIKVSLETASWTIINFVVIILSVLSWWVFTLIYDSLYMVINIGKWRLASEWSYPLYGYKIMGSWLFWLTVLLTVVIAVMRDVAFKAWRRMASVELYYEAIAKGKNVSKEAFESGFPIEEGIPIRLKGKVTVKGLFGKVVDEELAGVLPSYHVELINKGVESYSGFAFSGEGQGKMMKNRNQSMLILNEMKNKKK